MYKSIFLSVFLAISVLFVQAADLSAQNIGVIWVGKSEMANQIYIGFDNVIKELIPGVKVTASKELADINAADKIYKQYQSQMDALIFLLPDGADHMLFNPPAVASFTGGINNPLLYGMVQSLDFNPVMNITGVTFYTPIEKQFGLFKSIVPDAGEIGIILANGDPGSSLDSRDTKKLCEAAGIDYKEIYCSNKDELAQASKTLADDVDMIIIGNQPLCVSNTRTIVDNADDIPVVAYTNESVRMGALASFSADDQKLGGMLAKSVFDVIKGGAPLQSIPFKTDPAPKLYVNKNTMLKLGITLPLELLEVAQMVE